jgi:hypothetical protein
MHIDSRCARARAARARAHNDFLWAKILLLHAAENLFIDFGAESWVQHE